MHQTVFWIIRVCWVLMHLLPFISPDNQEFIVHHRCNMELSALIKDKNSRHWQKEHNTYTNQRTKNVSLSDNFGIQWNLHLTLLVPYYSCSTVKARNVKPFLLKLQALWKKILLATNFVTDVWKKFGDFIRRCKMHWAYRSLCMFPFLYQ
jgi:hypothetical protein